MQMNIMELIKEGKINDTLRSRGGQRYSYNRYVFVKTRKDTVIAYEGNTWTTLAMDIKQDVATQVCTLTPNKVIFKLSQFDKDSKHNWRKDNYNTWAMSGFLSLNFLFHCYARYSHNQALIETNNKGAVVPFSRMEFDWNGNLISEVPKKAQIKYDKWYNSVKTTRNAQSRARYAQAAAEREFRKYDKAGKLEEYPIENVFTIQNAQLRSYALNAIGLEKVLAPYPTKVIDKDVIDGRPYELVDIELPSLSIYQWGRRAQSQPKWCLYLKMTNPSTGEYHLEGVPRKDDNWNNHIPKETVKGALAWRDGEIPPTRYNTNTGQHEKASEWKYIEPTTIT